MNAGKSPGFGLSNYFIQKKILIMLDKVFFVVEEHASLWQQHFIQTNDQVFYQFIQIVISPWTHLFALAVRQTKKHF